MDVERIARAIDPAMWSGATDLDVAHYPDGGVARRRRRAIEAAARVQALLREAVRGEVASVLVNAGNYPSKVTPHILGQNMQPLIDQVAAALGVAEQPEGRVS